MEPETRVEEDLWSLTQTDSRSHFVCDAEENCSELLNCPNQSHPLHDVCGHV